MSADQNARGPLRQIPVIAALVWVVGFLWYFYCQPLPNNAPYARTDVWEYSTHILNPLDYSDPQSSSAGWQNLSQRRSLFGTAAFLLAIAWGIGRAVSRRLAGITTLHPAERLVIDVGGGLSLLSLWTLGCGLAGHLSLLAISLPAFVLIPALWPRSSGPGLPGEDALPKLPQGDGRSWLWLMLAIPFVLNIALGAATPSMDFDVREYHLQGPKEWYLSGQISFLDHNVYTSFPFLSEMLSLAAMVVQRDWWHGALAGKVLLTAFQFLSALTAWAICRRWFGSMPATIATIAMLSTPWTTRISIIAYAEGATSFYTIASGMMALLALRAAPAARRSFWIISGFFAGSAMAAKYPGLFSAVVPVGSAALGGILFRTSGESPPAKRAGQGVRLATLFTVGTLVAVGPWLTRNALVTGNPVYPLAWSVFGGDYWDAEMEVKWKGGHSPSEHEIARIPQHLLDMAVRNDWQNGLLFAFAVPALLLVRRFPQVCLLWGHTLWVIAVWWALTHRIDRFWVPVIPLLAVLTGTAWRLSESRMWRVPMLVAVVVCCTYNYGLSRTSLIGFHGGLEDLTKLRQKAVRADFAILNATLPDSARVLMVGEAEVFDAEFDVVYNTVFDESLFERWTAAAEQDGVPRGERRMKPADEIRTVLQQNNVTHIMVNWQAILRYRLSYGYTDYVFPERFEQLVREDLLEKPVVMASADWTKISDRQKQEVLSWPGQQTAQSEQGYWNIIELYRVRAEP